MNLLPRIHIHTGNCVTTFEFHLGSNPVLVEDALSVFEHLNSSHSSELWAFRSTGKDVVVYSPPITYNLERVEEYALQYRMCDPARIFNWLPPSIVSSFIQQSEQITVIIEAERAEQLSLKQILLHPNRV